MIKKKKSVHQQKREKLLKIQTGGIKIEQLQKMREKLKNRTKNDCHRYKLEARRAVRDYTS